MSIIIYGFPDKIITFGFFTDSVSQPAIIDIEFNSSITRTISFIGNLS